MNERVYRILIAEDDGDIVEVLKLYLENQGYEVLAAPNGRIAYEIIQKEEVDMDAKTLFIQAYIREHKRFSFRSVKL